MERLAAHALAAMAIAAAIAMAPVTTPHTAANDSPSAIAAALASAGTTSLPSAPTPAPASRQAPLPGSAPESSAPDVRRSALAASSAPCSDAHQLGSTAYASYNGATTFSIKLFYSPSCHAYYGYAFPWLQFRHTAVTYTIGLAVFDVTKQAIDGAVTFVDGAGGPDFWSAPVPAVHGDCVEATAHVFYPNWEADTFTVKYCG